jgi:hypothetical protein
VLPANRPKKWVRILTPPNKHTSKELVQAAGGFQHVRSIKHAHVADALLPAIITLADGAIIERPPQYTPPAG